MASNLPVNPPPQLQIPRQFLSDNETRTFFDQQRTILFQLWTKVGGPSDAIVDIGNTENQAYNSYIQFAQQQLDGLPQFTIDTSGFTVDTGAITTDKVVT